MSGTERHSVLIDLDRRKESRAALWQRIVLICIGTALAAAALLTQRPGEPTQTPAATATPKPTGALVAPPRPATLVLPQGVIDVELSAFPDWLANEPPAASLRAVVAIRGTMGIASVEGPTVVNWTERGISYRLESVARTVPELVVLADSLR
jgi:hypothetical protein